MTEPSDQEGSAVTRILALDGKRWAVADRDGDTVFSGSHDSGRDHRLRQRIDRLGRVSRFGYDASGKMAQTDVADPPRAPSAG